MKTPRQLATLLALLALLTLNACSMQKLAERITPAGDLPLVQHLFSDINHGRMDTAMRLFDASDAPSAGTLEQLHALLDSGTAPILIGVNVNKVNDQPWHTRLTYQFGHGDRVHDLTLRISGPAGQRHLTALSITPGQDMSSLMHLLGVVVTTAGASLVVLIVLIMMLVRRRRRTRGQ